MEVNHNKNKKIEIEYTNMSELGTKERPISKKYRELDTDLARDNLENDIPAADLQDL